MPFFDLGDAEAVATSKDEEVRKSWIFTQHVQSDESREIGLPLHVDEQPAWVFAFASGVKILAGGIKLRGICLTN